MPPQRIISGVMSGLCATTATAWASLRPTARSVMTIRFVANPLVFCGTGRRHSLKTKSTSPVVAGDYCRHTGRPQRAATAFMAPAFSAALEEGISSSVVQIGHAIMEKRVMDVLLAARDRGCYRGITDCGAGDSSAIRRASRAKQGVRVDMEKAPMNIWARPRWEIWVSEIVRRAWCIGNGPMSWPALKALADSEGRRSDAGIGNYCRIKNSRSVTAARWPDSWTWIFCTTACRAFTS